MKVYQAINQVQSDLAKSGIAKDRTNQQGSSYKFRGIDDVYNAVSPLLAKHGLCILPRMISRQCLERQTAKGNAIFYVTVEAEFDFVSAEDGSKHTVRIFGEAMDVSDKATNKAMSAAYKYAAFQAFAIPTEGDNDTETHTHEIASGLSESAIADHQAALDACANFGALKEIFAAAYAAARAANDGNAADRFKKIYDARKAEMLGGQA
jgi:hypothetical protein